MDDISYIEEIDWFLNNLITELRESKYSHTQRIYLKRIINSRCNGIELYARALRDKLENG